GMMYLRNFDESSVDLNLLIGTLVGLELRKLGCVVDHSRSSQLVLNEAETTGATLGLEGDAAKILGQTTGHLVLLRFDDGFSSLPRRPGGRAGVVPRAGIFFLRPLPFLGLPFASSCLLWFGAFGWFLVLLEGLFLLVPGILDLVV